MIVFLIALTIELFTFSLVSVWFCVGALMALLANFLGAPMYVQMIVFIVSTIIFFALAKPFFDKHLTPNIIKTNIDAIIGKTGTVTHTIDNLKGEGQIKINGLEWTARSLDGTLIKRGTIVAIEKIEGVKVIVSVKK